MPRMILAAALAGLALAWSASTASADVVHLKNGGRVEGVVTDRGDSVLVTHRFGSVTISRADILSVEKSETLQEKYAKRRSAIDVRNPDALVDLGRWLRENGWEAKAEEEFLAALAIDPGHRAAHSALGHVFYEGAWRTEDEIMERRGFVKHEGKWVTEIERERLLAVEERAQLAKERERELRALNRRLQSCVRLIAYGTREQCDKAHDDLVALARENGNEALERFAGDVRAWFDRYWQEVRRANAITEVQATMATLKRPIPTFTTSLGAMSTPVTLQLPEMQIWSVKTTVPIPAGR